MLRQLFVNRNEEPVTVAAVVVILTVVVLACAALVAVPLWTAVIEGGRSQATPDECRALASKPDRHACYDRLRLAD